MVAPAALVLSCNVHEVGHALVATALGWEVERVNLCLPGGGSVEYSRIGTRAGNLEGYAGGATAAAFLGAVYALGFHRPARPRRGPSWKAAGLGIVLWVGPQVVIGIMEGQAGPDQDYRELFRQSPAVYLTLLVGSLAAGAAAYLWNWRSDGRETVGRSS